MKKLVMMAMMATVICAQAIAQFKVTFQVNDSTGEGEPFATIRLYNATDTSKVITTGVTTLEGAFSQNIAAPGSYKILISAVAKTLHNAHLMLALRKRRPTLAPSCLARLPMCWKV